MNRDANLVPTLRQVPIFRELTDEECSRLCEAVEILDFKPNEVLLNEGDCGRHLWVLLAGVCQVVRFADANDNGHREPVVLATLEPHSQFGEMSFFRAAPHSASVRATTAVRLLRISRGDYDRLVEQGSAAAYKLTCNAVESLADRLERMDAWVEELLRSSPKAAAPPPIGEWESFRQRLFTSWNL
jgi:CRP/FNR family transcriptional regulator, cyclic AMP receptor protein